MTLRAAIYARQSLDRSGEGLAVSRQLDDCRRLAADRGWGVLEEYVDNDVSATSTKKPRPEWTRLMKDLAGGQYDVLVCWHTDRLYRRLRDLVELVEIAEQNALRIATVKAAELDLSTAAGRMLATMLGSAARYEAEQKGARQLAANIQARKAGRMPWTRRPFGYDLDDSRRIVVVEPEAEHLRRIAQAALAGATLAAIARDLDARGVATSTGGAWSVNAVKRILVNPRYAGTVTHNGERIGVGAWQPIIDQTTHAQLVAILTAPGRRTTSSNAVKYLLSGIARCGRCGSAMFASPAGPKGKRYVVYRCAAQPHLTRRADYVDEVVEGVIISRLSRQDALEVFAPAGDASALAGELATVRGRLDKLAELFADGAVTAAGLRDASARLREREASLAARLARVQGDPLVVGLVGAADIEVAWASLPIQKQRGIVEMLLDVTVLPVTKGARFEPDQVEISWRH